MTENIYEFVMEKLEGNRGRWAEIARLNDMSAAQVIAIATKRTKSPNVHDVQALYDYFNGPDYV